MKSAVAITENVIILSASFQQLLERGGAVPGLGLLYGNFGTGKTTAWAWIVGRTNALYLRATSCWTTAHMLNVLAHELKVPTKRHAAKTLDAICAQLLLNNRPLIIDEGDYLFQSPQMPNCLRDIHDNTGVPVWVSGMSGIEKKVATIPLFHSRLAVWVEFRGCSLKDTVLLTEKICEVKVCDKLIERMCSEGKGNTRRIVVALARLEAYAQAHGWSSIEEKQWGDQPFWLNT